MKSCAKIASELGRDGVVFNTSFQYISSRLVYLMIGQLWQFISSFATSIIWHVEKTEKLFFRKWAGSWATSLLFRFSRSSTLVTGSLARARLNEKRSWRWIKSDLIIRLLCHYLHYLKRSWRLMVSQEPVDEFLLFVNLTVCICAGNKDSRRTTQ